MALLEVLGGLVLLVLAGDGLVRGAVTLASRLGVPTLIISLTIIAFGTSAPELVVGVDAVLKGSPTLALGNVVGSNIANVLLVIGLPAVIAPVACSAPRLGRNFMMMTGATLLVIGLGMDNDLGLFDAIILVTGLILFLGYSAYRAHQHRKEEDEAEEEYLDDEYEDEEISPVGSMWLAGFMLVGGLLGLAIGADLLVNGSVTIARSLGVSEAVIGLTLVAIGTSLPELVTALAAAFRGHSDVAMGSVIGSNMFNLLGILGISSLVGHIPVPDSFIETDFWIMLGSIVILAPFIRRRGEVGRLMGLLMVGGYTAYMVMLAQ